MLKIARYRLLDGQPSFCGTVEAFLVMLCCVSNLLFPGCPLHALDDVLSNAVVDRVRVVRLENYYRQKQINGVRVNMSENVLERGTEYPEHNNV